MSDDHFLSRWSRRKAQAKGSAPEPAPAVAPLASVPAVAAEPAVPEVPAQPPLPPVESLTLDSDFAPFMQPGVDASLRRTALKTLLGDPRFNIMDGLDVYIDDYSKPDPLPAGWLEKLNMASRLGDYQPPKEPAGEAREPLRVAENPEEQQPVAPASADREAPVPAAHSPTREEPKAE